MKVKIENVEVVKVDESGVYLLLSLDLSNASDLSLNIEEINLDVYSAAIRLANVRNAENIDIKPRQSFIAEVDLYLPFKSFITGASETVTKLMTGKNLLFKFEGYTRARLGFVYQKIPISSEEEVQNSMTPSSYIKQKLGAGLGITFG